VEGTGTLLVQMTDAPVDNLVKFEITVESITLNPGGVVVLSDPVRVELTRLEQTTQLIRLATMIEPADYDEVEIVFSAPEIRFCPQGSVCSATNLEEPLPTLTNDMVTLDVNLSLDGGEALGLLLDFDLRASVDTNINNVNPQVTVSAVDLGDQEDEFEARGRVAQVTPDSSTFVLQVFGPCQRITVTVDGGTFEDFDEAGRSNDFDGLARNQIVDVQADARTDGALVATRVKLRKPQDDEDAEGIIVDAVRNSITDAVSQFTLVAQQLNTCATGVPADDLFTVAVDSGTDFEVDDMPGVNPPFFDQSQALAVGQKVEVSPGGLLVGTSFTAAEIRLSEQSIRGLVTGTDPVSGIFQIFPSSDVFGLPSPLIQVNTSADTEFEGASGVGELFDLRVRVRGLLFRTDTGLVLVAEKVEAEPLG
jgi:hypothetical protein